MNSRRKWKSRYYKTRKKVKLLKLELEKKDKIIDELILSIAENYCSIKDIVREDICDNRCVGNNNWTCYKCIKQYFERKADEDDK